MSESAKLKSWQLDILDKMTKYKGKGLVQITGRGMGKSTLNNVFSGQAFQRLWDDIHNRPVEDLILSEGKVHGARYYCVSPVGGKWHDMELWCKQTFGEPGDMWDSDDWCWPESARWLQNDRKFWFLNLKDRDWFILKWNS